MKKIYVYFIMALFTGFMCACNSNEGGEQLVDTPVLQVFEQTDIEPLQDIKEYSYEEARKIGITQEVYGVLPGASEGIWAIVEVDGIEYYYGKYATGMEESYELFNYSIIGSQYVLSNGIAVGMKEEELRNNYPDMAVLDFENNNIYDEVSGAMAWNGSTYPRSYIDMDPDFEYDGNDYIWTNQFDYVMIGNILLDESDELPLYLALFIKDKKVAAISYYYPTVG